MFLRSYNFPGFFTEVEKVALVFADKTGAYVVAN